MPRGNSLIFKHATNGGKASGVARRSYFQELKRLRAELAAIKENQVLVAVEPTDLYTTRRLTRTRAQIDAILDMLESETDAQALDRLASALARLNEIERQLANRPLPGSFKPERARPARPQAMPTPEAHTPAPAPLPTPNTPTAGPQEPEPNG